METSEVNCVRVTMKRRDTGQPWGFRMTGGKDLGCVLYIAKVNPRSLSARFGLRTGDRVVMIEGLTAHNLNHDQAKAEILRAGNDLHLVVERGTAPVAEDPMANRRSVVVEERTEYRGDTNPTSQSRTFHLLNQFLQEELETLAPEKPKAPKVVNGPKPTAKHGPVSGSTYTSVQKPAAGGEATQPAPAPAPAPAKEPVKANPSPATVPAPAKQSMQASVAKLAEAPPKKLVEKPAAVPPPASKPEAKVVAAPANVQAKPSPAAAAAAAPVAAQVGAGAKSSNAAKEAAQAKSSTAAKETASVQDKAKSSGGATGAVLAQAEAKSSNLVKEAVKEAALIQAGAKSSDAGSKAAPKDVPDSKPPAAAEPKAPEATTESVNVKVEESAPILVASTEEAENVSFEISAEADTNFSVDLPADTSANIEVSESVDEPITIVAIAGTEDIAEEEEGEYADEDYTDGSVSEEEEEETATFTLQLS